MRYTIQRGDTLWDLARKHGTTVDDLLRMNPHIQDRNKIYAGRAINLPDASPGANAAAAGSSPSQVSSPQTSPANPVAASASTPLEGQIRPPLFPNARPVYPNTVEQDAAAANQGMDPGAMDPMELALGSFVAANAIAKAVPALAKMAPAALPAAGRVAYPMSRGAVPHAGAAPAWGNVRPVGNNPEGVAAAMMSGQQAAPQSLPEMIQWYMQQAGQNAAKNWGF